MKAYSTGIKVDMDSITKGPTIKKLIDTGHLTNMKQMKLTPLNFILITLASWIVGRLSYWLFTWVYGG